MESLSPPEQGALNEFVIITGASLDDDDLTSKAVALLSRYNFDLNNSVSAYFDHGFDSPQPDLIDPEPIPEASFASGMEAHETTTVHRNMQDDFYAEQFLPKLAKAPRIANKWQFDLGIYMSRKAFAPKQEEVSEKTSDEDHPRKLSIFWSILLIVPKTLTFILSALKFILGLQNVTASSYPALRNKFDYENYNEHYSVQKSIEDDALLESYNISFHDFNKCHESAQNDFNFLLILLVDERTENCLHRILSHEKFKALFDKKSGTFKESHIYAGNVSKQPEAFEIATAYKARRLPHVTLIGNVTRDPSIMSSMSIMHRSNIPMGDDEEISQPLKVLFRQLKKSLTDFNPQLVAKRFDKQEIELSRLIRTKQDEAYQESLNHDKIKRMEKETKLREESLKKEQEGLRLGFITHLSQSNYFANQVKEAAPKEVVRISIKLPDGRRIVQKFLKSALMCEIYLFVETQLLSEEEQTEALEMEIGDFNGKFTHSFDLFKPLPKTPLPPTTITIEDFKELVSGDNVLFEYTDDVVETEHE